ncbi:MAG: hypothetical protein M5U26_28620 [Planctomycetota bacterium]|nr:hypothetical protein [Planctomycetota bacterium]
MKDRAHARQEVSRLRHRMQGARRAEARQTREDSVVGQQREDPVPEARGHDPAGAPHAGVDHRADDRPGRQVRRGALERQRGGGEVLRRQVVGQVQDRRARGVRMEHQLHLPDVGALRAEIGQQHDEAFGRAGHVLV